MMLNVSDFCCAWCCDSPKFCARSDLEQLLSSHDAADWIKISEMVIGPTPPDYRFTPKHKSNSYANGSDEGAPEAEG